MYLKDFSFNSFFFAKYQYFTGIDNLVEISDQLPHMFCASGALAGPLQVKYEEHCIWKRCFKPLENSQIETGLLGIT